MEFNVWKLPRLIFLVFSAIEIKYFIFISMTLLLPFLFVLENISDVDAVYKPVKAKPTMIEPDMHIERVFKGNFEPSSFAFLDSHRKCR